MFFPHLEDTNVKFCNCITAGACAQEHCVSLSPPLSQPRLQSPLSLDPEPTASLKITRAKCLLNGSHYSVSRCLPQTEEHKF